MHKELLTIIIPTYNRAAFLKQLLELLVVELASVAGVVRVIIGDNASQDETAIILKEYPQWTVLRHPENCGAEENFRRCLNMVDTPYFWVFGDDDLPRTGFIVHLLDLLRQESPDLVYINNHWCQDVKAANRGSLPVSEIDYCVRSREGFSRVANVSLTFISGVVVSLKALKAMNWNVDLKELIGSGLIQLGWVLPLLMMGQKFVTVKTIGVYATVDNSGGYKLFQVFSTNFIALLKRFCGVERGVGRILLNSLLWFHIPGLVWATKVKGFGQFIPESVRPALEGLRGFWAYHILIWPVCYLNRRAAWFLMLGPRIYGRLLRNNFGMR